jgi:nicotinamide phosphoribosyltransferase
MSYLNNPILRSDSYKYSHAVQLPKGTTTVFSHGLARGSKIEGVKEVTFFGLQGYIKDVLLGKRITVEDVEAADRFITAHGLPFNKDGWMRIATVHNGYMPVRIRAVPEGTKVPTGCMMYSVENLDETMPWLTSYLETDILRNVWYGSTVATISRYCREMIYDALVKSSDDPDGQIEFKLHDFGFRGVSSFESAGIGGAAHLINFMGTDTVAGIAYAMEYYNSGMCGFSIPASEHSTMTTWGRNRERDAYANMVDRYAGNGKIFAVVSDSYDIYNAVENIWAGDLLERVAQRGATVVIRPDSGDPTVVPIELIEKLMAHPKVGYTVNKKGFKVLPPHVRLIQGDGINFESLRIILDKLLERKISIDNIAFGMGAGLLQKCDRDTFKFAMKASWAEVDGQSVHVYKDPVTDKGKKSMSGKLAVFEAENGVLKTTSVFAFHDAMELEFGKGYARRRKDHVVYESFEGNVKAASMTFDEVKKNSRK